VPRGPSPCIATEGSAIDKRSLGKTGVSVSVLGIGCATLGAFWQGRSDADWKAALDSAIEQGINVFDTADSYGRGRSEYLLGKALKGRERDVIVITKTGLLKTPSAALRVVQAAYDASAGRFGDRIRQTFSAARRDLAQGRCVSSEYVVRAVAASQRRLRRSPLDIFLLHSPPAAELQSSQLIRTLHELRRTGMVRWWGVSPRTIDDGAVALEMPGIDCLELELNLCNGEAAAKVVSRAAERGVAVIARQPFGSGTLVRQADAAAGPWIPAGQDAAADSPTVLQACLQYPLSVHGVSTVIAGMARAEHVARNTALLDSDPLPSDKIDSVRQQLCVGGRGDH
jgi:aryl-alcohol dehydrogenase-like predicted oxidoreductase